MVKPVQRGEIKSFSGGLNTEAPLLQFPENSSQDELNFDVSLDGTRHRRLGFNVERDGRTLDSLHTWTLIDSEAHNSYLWESVGGIGGKQFLVVQIGISLYFFDPTQQVMSTVGLKYIQMDGADATVRFGMSGVEGYLIIVSGNGVINVVEYDQTTDALTMTQDRIKIRDLFGVQETIQERYELENDYRGELNPQHYFNLYNQGWAIPRYEWKKDPAVFDAVALGGDLGTTHYPGNGDNVWLGIQERPINKEDDNWISAECFHYKQFKGLLGSTEPSARGFFIIDAFRRGQSRNEQWNLHKTKYPEAGNLAVGSMIVPDDYTVGGPTCVADHAGRIFFSGCGGLVVNGDRRSPNYGNYIFFSQLVRNRQDLTKCYQVGDPTSRENSDLLDTDGGFLKISEAKNIMAMFSMGSRLIVLAENGIWSVTGGSDYGFSATNYKVDKLSTYGTAGRQNVVQEGSSAYYWGIDAIYRIGPNEMGDVGVEDVTTGTIKSFYGKIARTAKERAFGSYDQYTRRISWMYHDTSLPYSEGVPNQELILDLNLGAFIPWTIQRNSSRMPFVIGAFPSPLYAVRYEEANVITTLNEDVIDTNGNIIGAMVPRDVSTVNHTRYISLAKSDAGNIDMMFNSYWDEEFRDWRYYDGVGVDAEAYLLAGDTTLGDAAVKKQVPYVTMFFENTEREVDNDEITTPSSCIGRVQWDFTDQIHSGRWSRDMQLYRRQRYRYSQSNGSIYSGEKLLITKNKMRGNGKAFALHLRTEPLNDLRIVGWSFTLTANGVA